MLGAEHIGKDRAGIGGGKYETDKNYMSLYTCIKFQNKEKYLKFWIFLQSVHPSTLIENICKIIFA